MFTAAIDLAFCFFSSSSISSPLSLSLFPNTQRVQLKFIPLPLNIADANSQLLEIENDILILSKRLAKVSNTSHH